MNKIRKLYTSVLERARWIFWTWAARLTEFAAHNRRHIYRVIAYGPLAATAAAAFVLGRLIGMMFEISLF